MHELSDERAVELARGGDRHAFRALVENHSRDVFGLAFRMTRNEDDAEDVVQETFIRAYQRIHRFEGRAHFKTWLYRITANSAIDLLRRRKRSETRYQPLTDVEPGVAGSQEASVFGRQVRDRIDYALGELSELERAAFVLRHCEELSIREISESLDITVNAAKQAIFRAVRKLRESLAAIPRSAT